MRITTTIAMLVVAAGLGAYIWFVERGRPSGDELARGERRVVPGFDRDGAKRIVLAREGERVVIEKDGDDWRLAEPIDAPADRGAVDRILSGVEFLDFERQVRDPGAAARPEYGLGRPRARVEIESASASVALAAGADDATGRGVYLSRAGGEGVYVVEKHFLETLQIPLSDLRDRKALRVTRSRVAEVAVESGGARWRAKRDKGLWRLVEPAPMAAAADRIDRLLTAIEDVQATRYLEDAGEPAALGLDPAAARVELDDGQRQVLRLGGPCGEHAGERYAARGDSGGAAGKGAEVFCVAEDKARALLVAPSEVELRKLVAISLDDLSAARISRGGTELRLQKKEDKWRIAAPQEAAADEEELRKWLAALGEYRVAETRPAGQAPAPAARVELSTVEGATVAIALGEADGAFRWARRDGDAVELKLAAAVGDLFDPAPARFRDKQVLSFSRYDAKRIALSGGGLADEELAYADGKWTLTRPAFPVDEALVDRNLGALADLKARRFSSEAAVLWALADVRRIEVTVEPPEWSRPDGGAPKGGKKTYTIEVRPALDHPDEDCWARSSEVDLPFVIARDTCDDLRSLHGALDLFDLDEEKLTGVIVKSPSLDVPIEKLGPDWHLPSGAAAHKEKVDALLASFRGRKARRLLRYGADASDFDPPRLVLTVKHDGRPDATLTAGRDLPDAAPAGHDLGDATPAGRDLPDATPAGRAARLSSRDATYLIEASLVEEVESAASALVAEGEDKPAPAR